MDMQHNMENNGKTLICNMDMIMENSGNHYASQSPKKSLHRLHQGTSKGSGNSESLIGGLVEDHGYPNSHDVKIEAD